MIFGKHMNRYYLRHAIPLLFGVLSLILVDVLQLKVPELYRMVLDGVNDGYVTMGDVAVKFDLNFLLDQICGPLIIIIISLVFGRFLWRICFFGSAIKVETDLRGRMFNHCKDLSQPYYQTNKVGNLMSLFTNDLETVQECFGMGMLTFCDAIFLGALSMYKMARMNGLLTILSMIPMGILLIASIIVGKSLEKKWATRQEAFSSLSDYSQESFSGISVIKAFVKEAKEIIMFKKLNKNNEKANVEYTKRSTLLSALIGLFIESVMCIILGYGGYLVYKGVFRAEQLIEFIGYFQAIIWPVMAISELIEMRSRGKASLNRISELLDTPQEVHDTENVREVSPLKGDIEFRNLTFKYPGGDYDVLKDVSFTINAGENVGIIGKTGSGKTTVVDLILRTYNVPDQKIFLDGNDVNEIPIHTVREYAAYVPQDNFLFSETIENNIAFASDNDDFESVKTAAELADIHDNITSFSDGYKTVLGERGVTVSGGQKQRISIARALMKNSPILILDDSVSAVDVKTEKVILDNLAKLRQGKTTILIAHRISTVERMDKLIFLEDGKVIAIGNHETLYQTCPEYRTMVELQKLDEKAKEEGANV